MRKKLLALVLVLLPSLLWAESKVFELNGKPVPKVVAIINGTTLSSAQLESEFINFRLRAQAQGKKISPSEEPLIAREVLKAEIMKELIAQKSRSLNIVRKGTPTSLWGKKALKIDPSSVSLSVPMMGEIMRSLKFMG